MSDYDSWDFEPAPVPAADSWDTWDTGGSATGGSFDSFGSGGGCDFGGNGNFGGNFGGKGDFGGPPMFDDFGKGNFGKGPNDFGKGMNSFDGGFDGGMNFGGPMDFGKGDFGKGDFGKGGDFMKGGDFGKGDFGKGYNDYGKGKNDFGKGKYDMGPMDFGKGGKDFGKDFSFKGGKGGVVVPPPPGVGMFNAGPPAGASAKSLPSGNQFAPMPPPMGKGPMGKGFDGGKGFVPQPFGQPPPPGGPPPPPGGMPLMPMNGNMGPPSFAKQMSGMAPDGMLALGMGGPEAENIPPPPVNDGTALQGYSADGGKKPRLFLLLTRLSPDLQNEHMQQILEQCGEVAGWRRAKDPSGQPLSFGFVCYADPEAAWKANTCINKLVLCGNEVKVLLEEQTESLILSWRNAQQAKMGMASTEEFEWELERKSVSCKANVDAKIEEIYGPGKGGNAASKRRQELRTKEQARILRVRKRKAWREAEFSKEEERVESMEKRLRRDEREKDGIDRAKEVQEKPKQQTKEEMSDLKGAKQELDGSGAPVEQQVAVVSETRVLGDLVDRIQSESRQNIFAMELDATYLRNEKSLEKKLRPWLERKIDLYMGGPQSDLVEYVLRRVNAASSAKDLLTELSRYLDDNAEPLVERMWRMLIFEMMRSGHQPGFRKFENNA